MESVWQETLSEHRARLAALRQAQAEYPEHSTEADALGKIYDQGGGYFTHANCGGYRRHFYHGHDLEEARKCMEVRAAGQYGVKTRLRAYRELAKVGLPEDSDEFFQNARLALAVKFDKGAGQFVPMTLPELLTEYMDAQQRHAKDEMREQFYNANKTAAEYVEAWAKFKPCNSDGAILFRRGTPDSFYKETKAGHQRFRSASEEWTKDKAALLIAPRCEAVQVQENKRQVRVTLFDGEAEITSWIDDGPPCRYETRRSYYGPSYTTPISHEVLTFHEYGEAIGFITCPPDLYAAHLGQKYVKGSPTDSDNAYAWGNALPNPCCTFTVDAAEFVDALRHGVTAASGDQTRPVLCTVFLEWECPNSLNIVSTDTYRLLLQEVNVLEASEEADKPNILLPADFCGFVARAMKKPTGTLQVRIGTYTADSYGGYVVEITGETVEKGETKPVQFLSRCVEGQFVNWRKVMPSSADCTVRLDPSETVRALKELAATAKEDANRVCWQVDRDGLFITAHDDKQQEALAVAEHLGLDGEPPAFAMNWSYAADYLKWQKEPVTLGINGPLNSLAFVNCRSKYIQMPMQIM